MSRLTIRVLRAAFIVAILSVPGSPFPVSAANAQTAPAGKAVYDKWCAGCHGDTGAGDGAAALYMLPRPRDFTKGVYQIRTTASGELPTDADIRQVIDEGMPGTAMPGWKTLLTEAERNDLVTYVKSFSSFFKPGAAPKAVSFGSAPSSSDDAIADGRKAYQTLECFKCHGQAGRGDGPSAPTLKDDLGQPIRAADLSASWKFNGGATVEQIYARLRTGLDGTPMPSFSDAVDAKIVTEEQLWHVAQWVRSLSPAEPPAIREVVRAEQVTALPKTPNDSAWNAAERFWIPLVGQIIVKPRWFAPTVEGVWVQAMHDGKQLTMRMSWSDPSKSPDDTWNEWIGRMSQSMTTADGALNTTQGPDQFVVQFPQRLTSDMERPYFLGGDTRRPVYAWRWRSTPDTFEEGKGTGLGQFAPRASSSATHASVYDNGEWRLMVTRALAAADTAAMPTFSTGFAIPVGFYAADGSSGEDAMRGSVSAWYAIYLDVPTPPRVYVAPAATMLLTAGLGVLAVARAQRRERGSRKQEE
jgi:DMSO reductase family type II enzyme heme b subunit